MSAKKRYRISPRDSHYWNTPMYERLEKMRDNMYFEQAVQDIYAQAKKTFEARKAGLSEGLPTSDVEGS